MMGGREERWWEKGRRERGRRRDDGRDGGERDQGRMRREEEGGRMDDGRGKGKETVGGRPGGEGKIRDIQENMKEILFITSTWLTIIQCRDNTKNPKLSPTHSNSGAVFSHPTCKNNLHGNEKVDDREKVGTNYHHHPQCHI